MRERTLPIPSPGLQKSQAMSHGDGPYPSLGKVESGGAPAGDDRRDGTRGDPQDGDDDRREEGEDEQH